MGNTGNISDTNLQINMARSVISGLKRITADIRAAIISYSDKVNVVKPMSPVDDVEKVLGGVVTIGKTGQTLSEALRVASNDVFKMKDENIIRSLVIFLTKDASDANRTSLIQLLYEQGINIFVIGLGKGVDQDTIDSVVGQNGKGILGGDGVDVNVIQKETIRGLFTGNILFLFIYYLFIILFI